MTKTTEQQIDMTAEVERAAKAAPSRAGFLATHEKSNELTSERTKETEDINRLVKERDAGKDTASSRAADLLAGKKPSDSTIEEELGRARRRLAVINEALAMQSRTVQGLRTKMSEEINLALRQVRQPLVTRMAGALRELRAAADEDVQLRGVLAKVGMDLTYMDCLVFAPVSGETGFDDGWLDGRRVEGYQV